MPMVCTPRDGTIQRPHPWRAHLLVFAYAQKGEFESALADLEKWRPAEDATRSLMLAYVYGRSGQEVRARHALEKFEESNRSHQLDPVVVLYAYIGMGNKGQAFAWLERAYTQRSNVLTTLKVDPVFDPLRGDPHFQQIMRRVGLAQ